MPEFCAHDARRWTGRACQYSYRLDQTAVQVSLIAPRTLARPVSVTKMTQPARPIRGLTPLSFQLDWQFNVQFAGLLLAQADGLFEAAGLEVELREWSDRVNVIDAVAAGTVDMACAEQNLILAAQAAGAPVRAVATMFHASPYGLMSAPDHPIATPDALSGKRVGVHVDGVKVMELIKGVNGLDDLEIVEIPHDAKFARVLSGEFAAVQCYVINEPIGVAKTFGMAPHVLKLSDHGFLSTAQTIVASDHVLAEKPDAICAFLSASFDGWARALADKLRCANIIVEQFVPHQSPYKDVAYQLRMLELIEPYMRGHNDRLGVIDAQLWEEAARLMLTYGIVNALPDPVASLAQGYIR